MWCFGEGFGLWSWFGGAGMMVLWVVVVALIVWGIIYFTRTGRFVRTSDALDIVRERYARGEITKDEYEQYRKNL